MTYTIWDFLVLLGSLGLFLFGMKFMSEGIQKAAGDSLRKVLGYMTSNRFIGVITGFLVTATVQSSSATTVMVVSFVNAGLLTLVQAVGVIMGANIGTTITAWLIAILGFKINMGTISFYLIAVAAPLMFLKRDSIKDWAEFVMGFAILFIALDFIKVSVPHPEGNAVMVQWLEYYLGLGFGSRALFLLLGTLLTMIIQSSSAAMALTMLFLLNGWIGFDLAAAMVIGENIGTTITAQLAAVKANVQAKRAALVHTLFNMTGGIVIFMVYYPFIDLIEWIISFGYGTSPNLLAGSPETIEAVGLIGIALFHTAFNIANTLLLIGFIPQIAHISKRIIPLSPHTKEDIVKIEYIESGLLATPELALVEAKREIVHYAELTRKMYGYVAILAIKKVPNERKLVERIGEYEETSDLFEVEIARYLSKISEAKISHSTSGNIRSMWSMINDLERIGDICYQMSRNLDRKERLKLEFSKDAQQNLQEMFELVDKSLALMIKNLNEEDEEKIDFNKVREIEGNINEMRDALRSEHFLRMEQGLCSTQSGLMFIDIVSSSEKIGDHVMNVNEAILGIK